MDKELRGIHHITAITGDPQRNVDFYTGVLGLRLVKLTVNFDDPEAYHIYYGDETGRPGTILTFFAWPGAPRGRHGTGQVSVVSFVIPEYSLDYWIRRFEELDVSYEDPVTRFGDTVIPFFDPDGLQLELVAARGELLSNPWKGSSVEREHAIAGFASAELSEEGYERTARLLTDTLGFRLVNQFGNRFRYEVGSGGPGARIDVICLPAGAPGHVAVGTVHHIAYRTPDDEQQRQWRADVAGAGLNVTPVIDREYFHSIYFRELGGVLFEIATEPPGFAIDEPPDRLGTGLMLPPWLEPLRSRLQQILPPIKLPEAVVAK